eukprot:CAMPEP_0171465334 /NCGR_PEP_ID=MMETSP0945-20130129/8421_1 /TAXON_ID=109269 /ORGANISM="Vaucheria litorea, Strain CCMP2940" /LENGTH=81 /DNA_ID=CAMNT_0011992855 /DNA_START=51 /DNA_END=293 /DNA_ORIENTATION=+
MIFDGPGSPAMVAFIVIAISLYMLGEAFVANDLVASSCSKIDADGKIRRVLNWCAIGFLGMPAIAALAESGAQVVRLFSYA